MEGFLPLEWAVFWTIAALPFMAYGIYAMGKFFSEHPEMKLSVALSGAFIVIMSSLKIPSVTGTSSHPTGTGLSVMLSGPWITVVICTIVLLFQGTFMAHGGFTTLGANVFSMGIAGPFAAYFLFKFLKKINFNTTATVFTVVCTANLVTYIVTALQLALVVLTEGTGESFLNTFITFLGIFALTQIPIAIAEGVMIVLFFQYLADIRPDLVKGIGYDTSVRHTKSLLDEKEEEKPSGVLFKTRAGLTAFGFAVATFALILFVYITTFFADIGGADDAGGEAIFRFIPGYEQLTENFIQLGEFGISLLFVIQTAIGILMLAVIMQLLRKRKHTVATVKTRKKNKAVKRRRREHRGAKHNSEFNSVDTAAYKSPMLHWSPLAKLLLIISLLVLDIASPFIWMSVFACVIGASLFLYGSSMRPPRMLMLLFLYAIVFITIGAFIFMIVMPGEAIASLKILGLTVNFTDNGVSFAILIFARATAALFLMFSFAVSTPVPHLAGALRKLRLPAAFVEMMVLIYRYTFLLMESAEKMHLAAECRFGYSGYKRSMSTTSKLVMGVFLRSLDVAEKGQTALQSRNYKGEFMSLSTYEKKNKAATVLCAVLVIASVIFFLMLRYEVIQWVLI